MLNNVSMILAKNDLWTNIINLFANWIVNYGWAIIVFTICLKLIMTPLDVYQRISSKKQQRFMTAMQPEMAKIQAKYGNDKAKVNEETAKLYKKYNFNMGGMCFSMLITMGLSLVVFFTLYGSLRDYGNDKLYQSYNDLKSAYTEVVGEKEFDTLTDDEKEELTIVIEKKYDEVSRQNSWLWVKNVWKSDTNDTQFIDFNTYANGMNDTKKAEEQKIYNFITTTIDGEKTQVNGYYVLIILSAVISFLTQLLSAKLMTPKGQKLNMMNKVMMAVIPITMIILAMTSNVVFTLYIIVNSLMTALISTVLSLIMKPKSGKDDDIVIQKNVEVVEYSRNYKK